MTLWAAGRIAAGAAALLLVGGGRTARADVRLRFEPSYTTVTTDTSDATGAGSTLEATTYRQRTVASYETRLFPQLRLLGFGTYESSLTTQTRDAVPGETDQRLWTVSGQLVAGDQVLGGSLALDRNQRSTDTMEGGVSSLGSDLVRQSAMLNARWRPADLPWLTLRLGRTQQFDEPREAADLTTDEASATVSFRRERYELRYRFAYLNPVDRVSGTDTRLVSHGARASWQDRLLDDRLAVYASYEVAHRASDTTTRGTTGTVSTQQIASQGLSITETPPQLPTRVTLLSNPALIDGDTDAGAGLDLGFGATGTDYRDLGAQLPDAVTPVNSVQVWVDRTLPAAIAGAITWEAYRSDDNLDWTPVAITGAVSFGPFENRFVIPVAETQARYLKVVARPLRVGVTVDDRYQHVFVTEVQLFLVVSAASVTGHSESLRGSGNGSARLQLIRGRALTYELAPAFTHQGGDRSDTRWIYSVMNALSSALALRPTLSLDSRLERTDFDAGLGREASNLLSASLGWRPLATLGGTLTYTGRLETSRDGEERSSGVLLTGRAEPYRGIQLFGNAGYSARWLPEGRRGDDTTVLLSTTLIPNGWLTLTGTVSRVASHLAGGGQPDVDTTQARVEGAATFNPVPALLASGSLARIWIGDLARNLFNLSVNVAPFPGGDLYLAFLYNETLDERTDLRTRNWGPALRWRIRGATSLDASYSVLDTTSPALESHTQAFTARLTVALP